MGKSLTSVQNMVQILQIYSSKAYMSSTVRALQISVQGCNFFVLYFILNYQWESPTIRPRQKRCLGTVTQESSVWSFSAWMDYVYLY